MPSTPQPPSASMHDLPRASGPMGHSDRGDSICRPGEPSSRTPFGKKNMQIRTRTIARREVWTHIRPRTMPRKRAPYVSSSGGGFSSSASGLSATASESSWSRVMAVVHKKSGKVPWWGHNVYVLLDRRPQGPRLLSTLPAGHQPAAVRLSVEVLDEVICGLPMDHALVVRTPHSVEPPACFYALELSVRRRELAESS